MASSAASSRISNPRVLDRSPLFPQNFEAFKLICGSFWTQIIDHQIPEDIPDGDLGRLGCVCSDPVILLASVK
jgi:hypothetical protein